MRPVGQVLMPPEATPETLAALAASILLRPRERWKLIFELEAGLDEIPDPPTVDFSDEVVDVLADLVTDLAYYVQNPEWRQEDASYYGNERLKAEVFDALRRLHELGVRVPDLEALEREWAQLDSADRLD